MPTTPVAATAMAPAISARLHLDQLATGPEKLGPDPPRKSGNGRDLLYRNYVVMFCE